MVADQHRPLRAGQLDRRGGDRAVRPDDPARAAAPEHVRPRITRVLQHPHDPRVAQHAPPQLARPRAAPRALREPPARERAEHPIRRAGRHERGEHVGDRRLDLLVGVDDRLAVLVIDVPDRESEPQLAALRGGALGALQPAGHHVQLGLGHLRLQPQQQPIVEVLQVIDPVSVQHQGVGQRAELKQPQEVRVVARQPRDLQPEDRADLAQTHPRDQLLVALPRVRIAARDAEIAVDDHDPLRLPTQPRRLLGDRVLTLGRADVQPHLRRR